MTSNQPIKEEIEDLPDSAEYADKIKDILGEDVDPEFLLNRHFMFIQLDLLCSFSDQSYCWKQMCRWLKYEEKVDASGRWSKPHVSAVMLRAFRELKHLFISNKVLLVLDQDTPAEWAECRDWLVDKVSDELQLDKTNKDKLTKILQSPHKHKNTDTYEGRKKELLKRKNFLSKDNKDVWQTCSNLPKHLLPSDLQQYQPNNKLKSKLPKDTEVANIWVGEVDVDKPVCVLVRFKEALLLNEATEVDLPTRLLFLILSKGSSKWQLYELGRAVAVLFNDKVFCEIAVKAENDKDILTGLNELIDDVCLLPPSVWDPSFRLDPPNTAITIQRLSRRLQGHLRMEARVEQVSKEAFNEDDSMQRSGKIFGGLVRDVKKRYPLMLSDITDSLHVQSISCVIFLFFACITPIVTFGGLMSSMTGGNLGAIEMLVAGSLCGLTYAMFSGQPLTIIGATGPLLIFETILYQLAIDMGLSYLPLRLWIGVWTFCLMMLMVAFDLSSHIKYITRFTKESFSVLISMIFIYEALLKLVQTYQTHKLETNTIHQPTEFFCHCNVSGLSKQPQLPALEKGCFKEELVVVDDICLSSSQCTSLQGHLQGPSCSNQAAIPDVFLLSCILLMGTFTVAYMLRRLRSSNYFFIPVRRGLADFSVLISLALWTSIDYLVSIDTAKLDIPAEFRNTKKDRGWFVNPLDTDPWWCVLVAFLPACLASILIFLDQQITSVIVNRKENKLLKPPGYHLDLFVISIQILLCSIFGLPWFCAATVRSISNVQSLVRVSENQTPGESPKVVGVREQRVTGVCVHLFIGLSIFGAAYLKYVPMPVLYGVLLFMGVTSLEGVQFVDRLLLLLMPVNDQPDYAYLRHVETKKVHIFTLIQVLCWLLMWAVKSLHATSLAFPLTLLVLVMVRKLLDKLFSQKDLFWLDNILPEDSRRTKEDQLMALDFAALPTDRRRSTLVGQEYRCTLKD